MGQVLSGVLNWILCAYRKRNSSSPRLSDPINPLTQKSEFVSQQNADHVITIVDDADYHHSVTPDFPDHEAFDDGDHRKYWSVVVDPDFDFPNQDQNRVESIPFRGDFEEEFFDDQVFTPSSSSSSDVAISTTISEEEQSPHSTVDDPKEVSPLSIVVDPDRDNRKESIPFSGDFEEFKKSVDLISRPIEKRGEEKKKKKKSDLIKPGIWINHYCSSHKILLVGEGDFSFSACLGRAFGRADNMVATSLNSQEFLKKNYGQAMSNIQSLKSRGCRVIHNVDATEMAGYNYLNNVKYDRIVYNFPHAGFKNESAKDQVRRHQNLVRLFMANARKMIAETGEIHISHKCNGFFQQWGLQKLAKKNGLVLIEEVKFNLSDYPGYNTKYGYGGDKNFDCNPSKTYKFRLKKSVCSSLGTS